MAARSTRFASFARLAPVAAIALLIAARSGLAAEPVAAVPDLSAFHTVENAVTTQIHTATAGPTGRAGYLGVHVTADARGRLTIDMVEAGSPAAQAGIETGDGLEKAAGQSLRSAGALRDFLHAHAPGDHVELRVTHGKKSKAVDVVLGSVSRPRDPSAPRAVLGVQMGEPGMGGILPVVRVNPGSPAEKAGLKQGDSIARVEGKPVNGTPLGDLLEEKRPGEEVTLLVVREGKEVELKAQLAADAAPNGANPAEAPLPNLWRKPVYRLAVIGIEYSDTPHNPKIGPKDWEESFFSKGVYDNRSSVTGQAVHGSMNDYYQEISSGAFHLEGHMFDWVQVSKPRADYSQPLRPGTRDALLGEAMDQLLKRDGETALNDYDGVFFLYAGARFPTNRGGLYWPHRSFFNHKGKRWSYFICPEGGNVMTSISVFCHEFGHMLGLPDLYARPENPGSEGLGVWCCMSNEAPNGRPQHFSAWCKERLGWLTPAVIDPTIPQKLILSAVEKSPKECYKVLLRPDGSEYLLLENRRKTGFDQSLPAEGLLIWRVVGNHPILEESHGVEGPAGPRVFLNSVPYPSPSNNAFTPFTTPSSRAQLGGGLPVYLTNISRLPDGRISFYVGYEFE